MAQRVKGTTLVIEKDAEKKFGQPQTWTIYSQSRRDRPLIVGNGKADTISKLREILYGCGLSGIGTVG